MRRFLPFVLLAASLTGFRSEDTYSLTPKRVKDAVTTYHFELKFETSEVDFRMQGKSRIKVLNVAEDGSYELEESTVDAKMTVNGADQEFSPADPKIQKYDRFGRRIKVEADGGPHEDMMTKVMSEAIDYLPGRNVKMGETWTRESEFGTIRSKLVGHERVGDIDCLKISVEAELNKGEAEGKAASTFFIRADDFTIEKGTSLFDNPKFGEDPSPTKIETELHRIPN